MSTDHFPPLQILNDNYQFVDAEPFVSNDTPSYRIYDAASLVPEDPSFSLGVIPLFRDDIPEYKQQYWRLNRPLGLVLGFIHTHLIQQQYSLPAGGYQPPIECVKTRMVIRMIEDRVFSAQTPVNISLESVPPVSIAESDECSQQGKQDVVDSKENRDMKIDCRGVSGSDDMQIPTRANCVESFLSSLKDLDLEEPNISVSEDSQSPQADDGDDLYNPKTLAPRPVRTPCATDTDTEEWEYGPKSSATSIIHHYTGRHEKVPWMMQKRYYPSLDGKMYLSSTF
ncbi:hypothetical protein VKT23_014234 [Stygiomarasmius scandens]|uniref:Uncharacterized protein n=1 Tax=Marasmiellus scandens TaxID=2682957 RepID=A0ABR1J3N4_9AGAR